MKNKLYFGLLVFLFAAIAGLAIYFNKPKKPAVQPTPTPVLEEQNKITGTVVVSAELSDDLSNPAVNITISPESDPLQISAFALSLNINFDQVPQIRGSTMEVGAELLDNGWVYPLRKDIAVSGNSIYFGVSAYHVGKTRFTLDKKTVVASIAIKDASIAQNIGVEIDNQNSKVLAQDAVSEFSIQVNEDQPI